jgi:hypothetical protein
MSARAHSCFPEAPPLPLARSYVLTAGSSVRTCVAGAPGANSTWNGTSPTCSPVKPCGAVGTNITNGAGTGGWVYSDGTTGSHPRNSTATPVCITG